MNSYLEKEKSKPQSLNANAKSFIPQMSAKQKEIKYDYLDPGARPKEKIAPQFILSEPLSLNEHKQYSGNHNAKENTQTQYRGTLNANFG